MPESRGAGDDVVPGDGSLPLHRPRLEGDELLHVRAALESGQVAADGPFSERVTRLLREETGAHQVLLTTSGTAALEMAALLLDVGPGDTVVVPSFTYVTAALAFARQGARILFGDIETRTLGLDPAHLEGLMDDSVRAVVPVHYAGVACDLDGIEAVLARWPRAELVEDNAHGAFSTHRGRPLGSRGRFAALSFHATKTFTCGEGGALLVNRAEDAARAEVVYHKGTDQADFRRGRVEEYAWQDVGSSFGLSDVLAAYLWGQLERRSATLARRREVFDRYVAALEPHAAEHGFRLPIVPPDGEPAHHLFHVLLADRAERDRVMGALRADGIQAAFHYVPLHSSRGGRRFAARPTPCPVTDDVSGRLLRLPFSTGLGDAEVDRVAASLLAALRDERS